MVLAPRVGGIITRAVEAVGADAFLGDSDAFHEVLDLAELQRSQVQASGYLLHHSLVFGRFGLGIEVELGVMLSFEVLNYAARYQFQIAFG